MRSVILGFISGLGFGVLACVLVYVFAFAAQLGLGVCVVIPLVLAAIVVVLAWRASTMSMRVFWIASFFGTGAVYVAAFVLVLSNLNFVPS